MEVNKNLTHPKYRSDIDGLRAIAVLSVVIYHAFPDFLKGGFIGVDIFFVISGFLISTIIFENLNNNSFSFATFYSRRIRRIFPALITVLITAVIFGYYVLFSDEFRQLGRHIIGGATFSSNFTLLKESGYFDTASEFKPLLHLWSLGIEEQFYIIFPIICYFLYKYNIRLLLFIIPFTIISYYLNIKGIKTDITKTFYFPHTRFWELLFGSLLAYFTINKSKFISSIGDFLDTIIFQNKVNDNSKQRLLNLLSILGFFILVYGLIRINATLKFPGKLALVPVIGSVLIILAGKEAIINKKILSNKILVWFGKISFPLYLWHWVLLAYARIIYGNIPPQSWRITLVIAAIILSYLTYKFIESPLRFGGSNKKKVIFLCSMMIIIGCFGYSIYKEKINTNNNLPNVVAGWNTKCGDLWEKGEICKVGNRNSNKKILVFGDSVMHHYTQQLEEQLGKNFAIDILDAPACFISKNMAIQSINYTDYNLLDNSIPEHLKDHEQIIACKKLNTILRGQQTPNIIIMGQQWEGYSSIANNIEYNVIDKLNLFDLQNKNLEKIIVVGGTVKLDFNCEKIHLRPFNFSSSNCKKHNLDNVKNFKYITDKIIKYYNVFFVHPYKYLCDENDNFDNFCNIFDKESKKFNYMDDIHFDYNGSKFVVNEIKKIIESK